MGAVKTVASVAAISLVTYGAYRNIENGPACVRGVAEGVLGGHWNLSGCTPNIHLGGRPAEANMSIGDFRSGGEKLTGTVVELTLGRVTMKVLNESKIDYNMSFWNGLLRHGHLEMGQNVDATEFFNRGGKGALTVDYTPCFRLEGNVGNPSPKPSPTDTILPNTSQPPQAGQQATMTYTIVPDIFGGIKEVDINAGSIGVCNENVPNTANNQGLWSTDSQMIPMPSSVDATFRQVVERLAMEYVASDACPERLLNNDAVRTIIARTALGEILAQHPSLQTQEVITKAYDAGKFKVNISSAAARQALARNVLQKDRQVVANMTSTLPGAGRRVELSHRPTIGHFQSNSCAGSIQQPFAMKPLS